MPKFEIDLPHALSVDEVRSRLSGATARLEQKYGARSSWRSDRDLVVTRMGLDAQLRIEETRLHIEITLGLLLRAFGDQIRNGIGKELAEILEAPPPPPPPAG